MEVADFADISNARSYLGEKIMGEVLREFWEISKPKIASTFF